MADQWYVGRHTPTGEQKSGPMPLAQLQQMAAAGQVSPTDLVYGDGMANWAPASSIPQLAGSIQGAPAGGAPAPAYGGPSYDYRPPASKGSGSTLLIILLVVGGGLALLCIIGFVGISMIGTSSSTTFSKVGSNLGGPSGLPRQYSRAEFDLLIRGKNEAAVRRELGEPSRQELSGNRTVWIYNARVTNSQETKVIFQNGIVTVIEYSGF